MGIAGILGGLVLFAGDMLFYYDPININLKQNMGNASDFRIMASGLTALIASWLYLLGLGHVYYAFKPAKALARNTVAISFAAILISYGVIHGAYVAIAATAKLAVQNNLDIETATTLASEANNLLRLLIYPIFGLFSIVFIAHVWKKKTLYPRWIIPFFPLIPFLLQGILATVLTGSLRIIILGGFLNLILVLFFTASTIALWNTKSENEF
jgi:hypothetical protein